MRPRAPVTRSILCLALLAAFCAAPGVSRADSWFPYGARREVDPTGRWSVVLKAAEKGMGADFTLAEAPPGAPAVTPIASDHSYKDPSPEVSVREGDTILANGSLKSAPLEVRLSSRGLGFAAMEEYGRVGGGVSFAWVGRDGVVRHEKRLADLFSADEIRAFTHTVSSTWWFRDAWIDEDAREVVVVGHGPLLRAVHLETGAVRKAGAADIRRALSHDDPAARSAAIDLVRQLKIDGVEATLVKMLADPSIALGVRLRAAATLAEGKDLRGKDLLVASAATPRGPSVTKADYEFALSHLPAVLGAEAIPLWKAAMRGESTDGWSAAMGGFAVLGEPGVPALLAMLTEAGQSNDYRGGAAHALGKIGSKASVAALVAAIADPEEYVANAAANAAIAIAKETIAKELAVLLDKPTTQDGRLSSYFEDVKEPTAVGPLVRALARHPKDEYPRNVIVESLVFQTGLRLGPETSAWTAWFAKQPR